MDMRLGKGTEKNKAGKRAKKGETKEGRAFFPFPRLELELPRPRFSAVVGCVYLSESELFMV